MNALVVVDIQADFAEGLLAVPGAAEIIPVINRLRNYFRLVAMTKDWHPVNHGSFAVNHPGKTLYATTELAGLPQVLLPVHCVAGSPGARFLKGLETRGAAVFLKGIDPEIDSYSGFEDNGRRRSTGLAEWLQEWNVDEVFVCGLATDFCVKATALDAVRLGFRCQVVADACRAAKPGEEERIFDELRRAGVEITTSGAVMKTFTITLPKGGEETPLDIRFAADAMLWRLAKWLRMLGYDVAGGEALFGRRLVETAVAGRRWVLTRNRRFAAELPDELLRLADLYVVEAQTLPDQLREVTERFSLKSNGFRFTRCLVCNEPLEPAEHPALDAVPAEVLAREEPVWRCHRCGRHYWHGSHVRNSTRELDTWLRSKVG